MAATIKLNFRNVKEALAVKDAVGETAYLPSNVADIFNLLEEITRNNGVEADHPGWQHLFGFLARGFQAMAEKEGEPPRVYRRAKLSENCPLWNRHQRRRPRSRIHLSSANARCGWRWNTAMSIKAKLRR